MCDRISPVDEFLKQFASAFVPGVQRVGFRPKVNAQSAEIRTNGARVRIAPCKASIPNKLRTQHDVKLRRGDGNDVINALGMKITTEALKVRR
jgi:hypothetical protein